MTDCVTGPIQRVFKWAAFEAVPRLVDYTKESVHHKAQTVFFDEAVLNLHLSGHASTPTRIGA